MSLLQDSVYSGKQIGQLARSGINASWQGLPLHPFDDGHAQDGLTRTQSFSYEVSRAPSLAHASNNKDADAELLHGFWGCTFVVYGGCTLGVYRVRGYKLLKVRAFEQSDSARLHTVNDMYAFAPKRK